MRKLAEILQFFQGRVDFLHYFSLFTSMNMCNFSQHLCIYKKNKISNGFCRNAVSNNSIRQTNFPFNTLIKIMIHTKT